MIQLPTLIQAAVAQSASDIHIQPGPVQAQIFFRVHGALLPFAQPPAAEAERLLAQIRVACGLDVSVRQVPQDGRFSLADGSHGRVSIMPTLHGSAAVLRLFALLKADSLQALGFSDPQADCLKKLVAQAYGLIVVVGPTGSGKTTTLYHLLQAARRPDRVLLSLEDPIEAEIPGVRQTACRPELGLGFAQGLRALLRQDPDVIMVGEIRDQETAEIALRAALTGHLVLTSIHARDTAEVLIRLLDLGIPAFQLASALLAGIAQQWGATPQGRHLQLEVLPYPADLYDVLKTQPSLQQLRSLLNSAGIFNDRG